MQSITPLRPTTTGSFVANTTEARAIISACIRGEMSTVNRRPIPDEFYLMFRSGNIMVYNERSSGISRWTDDRKYSDSRMLGNFMLYREGMRTKKHATTSPTKSSPPLDFPFTLINNYEGAKDIQRSVYASLNDSSRDWAFKPGGLVKKTFRTRYGNDSWVLINYYTVADLVCGDLQTVTQQWPYLLLEIPHELESDILLRCPLFQENPAGVCGVLRDAATLIRAHFEGLDEGQRSGNDSGAGNSPDSDNSDNGSFASGWTSRQRQTTVPFPIAGGDQLQQREGLQEGFYCRRRRAGRVGIGAVRTRMMRRANL